ncbi:hypothetical protein TRFO_12990 [Tritrichomonas foetus]|uniref:Uncharacterized protein n=1 Tax=Tritrichomonas foetus TaxID=1144522 RepID=A0A1J4KZZ6_9EUKA|nr:hypothetical protein TRFO_12990 [Tritrichomonas foetus]|eukprot:OHT16730.1 hypothetical protein TRFO_12990 [Tritrichomonas foetus]
MLFLSLNIYEYFFLNVYLVIILRPYIYRNFRMNDEKEQNFLTNSIEKFEKLVSQFLSQEVIDQSLSEQITELIFSCDFENSENDIKTRYYQSFLSIFSLPKTFPLDYISSTEFLSLISVGLTKFNNSKIINSNFSNNQPNVDIFMKNWSKFTKKPQIDQRDLFKFCIIFKQFLTFNNFPTNHLEVFLNLFMKNLRKDCLNSFLPIYLISNFIECISLYLDKYENNTIKDDLLSICFQYIQMSAFPMKVILATNFIMRHSDEYEKCLRYITESLNTFNEFHEDSLFCAFISIFNLSNNLKSCSFQSISDAFSAVSKFNSHLTCQNHGHYRNYLLKASDMDISQHQNVNLKSYQQIIENQINAMMILNFYGVDKYIDNVMEYFNLTINLLMNEDPKFNLYQICESFRFSPISSIRNYQIFVIFSIYGILAQTTLHNLECINLINDAYTMMQGFGRNLEYFKTLMDSLLFFNQRVSSDVFEITTQLGAPIIRQFILDISYFFQINVNFASKFGYPDLIFSEIQEDIPSTLLKFAQKNKIITKHQHIWDIVDHTTNRILEIMSVFPNNINEQIFSLQIKFLFESKIHRLCLSLASSFLSNMNLFLIFLMVLYKEVFKNLKSRAFIQNTISFLAIFHRKLKINYRKCVIFDSFLFDTNNFLSKFIQFSLDYPSITTCYISLANHLIKIFKHIFNTSILTKLLSPKQITEIYFKSSAVNKHNKMFLRFIFKLHRTHGSVLLNFEWYQLLIMKYAYIKPKIAIPVINDHKLIIKHQKTPEYYIFAKKLLKIFDTCVDPKLKNSVLTMINTISVKNTFYASPKIEDITQFSCFTFKKKGCFVLYESSDLFKFLVELETGERPLNQFDKFVEQYNITYQSNEDVHLIMFQMIEQLIEKNHNVQFIQKILSFLLTHDDKFMEHVPQLNKKLSANLIVAIVLTHSQIDINFNSSTQEFYDIVQIIEYILSIISFPCHQHATLICEYLIEHFPKDSIDFVCLTKFVLFFVIRYLNEQLELSFHSNTTDIKSPILHHLPTKVFDIVIFIKENAIYYDICYFLPLLTTKLPFIATFALCEIMSSCQQNDSTLDDFVDQLSNIDLVQIIPLLSIFPKLIPKFHDKFEQYFNEIENINSENVKFSLHLFLFYYFCEDEKYSLKLIELFINHLTLFSISDSTLVADFINKLIHKNKKSNQPITDENENNDNKNNNKNTNRIAGKVDSDKIICLINQKVNEYLLNEGLFTCDNIELNKTKYHSQKKGSFISKSLKNKDFLFPLFILSPANVIETLLSQIEYLNNENLSDTKFFNRNLNIILSFFSLPYITQYLLETNDYYMKIGQLLLQIYYRYSIYDDDLFLTFFMFNSSTWSEFILQHISESQFTYFFYTHIHSEKLSSVIADISSNTEILENHLQNEFVQFFAIENSSITYNSIQDAFNSCLLQKNRWFLQSMISYLVDNGEIWTTILEIIKTNKLYLIQILKYEIIKNDNHEFDNLFDLIPNIPQQYVTPFFEFVFECYHEFIDSHLLNVIIENLATDAVYSVIHLAKKYNIQFEEINSNILYEDGTEYDQTMMLFYNNQIFEILDHLEIDSHEFIFKLIENYQINEYYPNINSLLLKFMNHPRHFLSVLKFIETNQEQYFSNPLENFSDELILFMSYNFSNTNDIYENMDDAIECFNIFFLLIGDKIDKVSNIWGKRLIDMAYLILPRFVKDDLYFYQQNPLFFNNLLSLIQLFNDNRFIKVYIELINSFYDSNSLVIHDLFIDFAKILSALNPEFIHVDKPFYMRLIKMINIDKHIAFPSILLALRSLIHIDETIPNKVVNPLCYLLTDNIPLFDKIEENIPFTSSIYHILFTFYMNKWPNNFAQVLKNVKNPKILKGLLLALSKNPNIIELLDNDTNINKIFFESLPLPVIQNYVDHANKIADIPLYYYKNIQNTASKAQSDFDKLHIIFRCKDNLINKFCKHFYDEINFRPIGKSIDSPCYLTGLESCIFSTDTTNIPDVKRKNISQKNSLLQKAIEIIGIPKSYPNTTIDRLNSALSNKFTTLTSKYIVYFNCLCSILHNPIITPHFTRYHPLKLFQDFSQVLLFAKSKGFDVDFSAMDLSENSILQANYSLKKDKPKSFESKRDFLIYQLQNNFIDTIVWANIESIANDDLLYLFLHMNLLPGIAKKEILQQIIEFPFHWGALLADDIKNQRLDNYFKVMIPANFRQNYRAIFKDITNNNTIKVLKLKSHLESQLFESEDEGITNNFICIVNSLHQHYTISNAMAPFIKRNSPMFDVFLRIPHENSTYCLLETYLADGTKIPYIVSGFAKTNPELYVLVRMFNKILQRNIYCRKKHVEMFSPQSVEIDDNLYLIHTDAKPLLPFSKYKYLLNYRRIGSQPKKILSESRKFLAANEYFTWETTFLQRFAALSYLQVGLNIRVPLPSHLLINEKNASIEFLQLRQDFGNNYQEQKLRLFGEMRNYLEPLAVAERLPKSITRIACAFKFDSDRIYHTVKGLLNNEAQATNIQSFTNDILKDKNGQIIKSIIEKSFQSIPTIDMPWF